MSKLYAGERDRHWIYYTTDSYSTIIASGYFNASSTEFRQYDTIDVISNPTGSPEYYKFIITAVSLRNVEVVDFSDELLQDQMTTLTDAVGGQAGTPTSTTATYSIAIQDNHLDFNISVNSGFTASRIYTSQNDATAPTSSTDGIAVAPFSGIAQFLSSVYSSNLPDYSTTIAERVWLYNASTPAWVQADAGTSDNGSGSIDITATYNNPPSEVSNATLTQGAAGSGELIVSWDAATSPLGVSGYDIRIHNNETQGLIASFVNATSPKTCTGLPVGTELQVFINAKDSTGNWSVANAGLITLDSVTTGTDDGMIRIREAGMDYSAAEDDAGGVITVYFDLIGNDSNEDVSFKVRTVDGPGCVGGTNFVAISDQIVNINYPDTEASVDITLINTNALTNNVAAQLHIVPDSADSTAATPTVRIAPYDPSNTDGDNAVIFTILGSVAAGGTAFAEEALNDAGGTANVIAFDASDYTGRDDKGYASYHTWENITSDGHTTLTGYSSVNGPMVVRENNDFYSATQAAALAGSPRISWDLYFANTGTHYIEVLYKRDHTWEGQFWFTLDGIDAFTPVGTLGDLAVTSGYEWATFAATFNVAAAGQKTLALILQRQWPIIDRIVIHDGTYDPSAVNGGDGPATSSLGGSSATIPDYPTILSQTTPPTATAATNYDPTNTSPTNGSTGIALDRSTASVWPAGTSNITVTSYSEADASSNETPGSTRIVYGTNGSYVYFDPAGSGARLNNTQYTVTANGTLIDPDNVPRPWSISGGDFQFTTVEASPSAALVDTSLAGKTDGAVCTAADAKAFWNVSWAQGFQAYTPTQTSVYYANYPEGQSSPALYGPWLKNILPANKVQDDGSVKIETRNNFSPNQEEIWIQYDLFIPAGTKWPKGVKIPGMMASNLGLVQENAVPDGRYASAKIMLFGNDPSNTWGGPVSSFIPSGAIAAIVYYYRAGRWRISQYLGKTDWDPGSNEYGLPSTGLYTMPMGEVVKVTQHLKMNTVYNNGVVGSVTSGVDYLKDGLFEVYINDVKRIHIDDIPWRTYDTLKWNTGYYTYFAGGSGPTWRTIEELHMYQRNFRIWGGSSKLY